MFLLEEEPSKFGVLFPLKYYAKEIGKILRKEHLGKYSTFEEGKKFLRDELLNHVNLEVAQNFFAKEKNYKNKRTFVSLVGELIENELKKD